MVTLNRGGTSLISAGFALVGVALLAVGLSTESWMSARIKRESNGREFDAGEKYLGLFHGCEAKRYGEYASFRQRCFTAFSELDHLVPIAAAYITTVSLCLSIGCLLLLACACIYSELVKSVEAAWILKAPVAVAICAGVLVLTSVSSYSYLYNTHLKVSILPIQDTQDGFTTSQANLGYSFWLVVCTMFIILSGVVIMFRTRHRKRESRNLYSFQEETVPREPTISKDHKIVLNIIKPDRRARMMMY